MAVALAAGIVGLVDIACLTSNFMADSGTEPTKSANIFIFQLCIALTHALPYMLQEGSTNLTVACACQLGASGVSIILCKLNMVPSVTIMLVNALFTAIVVVFAGAFRPVQGWAVGAAVVLFALGAFTAKRNAFTFTFKGWRTKSKMG